jgi:hypothetical protein
MMKPAGDEFARTHWRLQNNRCDMARASGGKENLSWL